MKVMVSETDFYQIMDTEGNKTDENTAAIEIFGTDCKKEKVGAVHSKLPKKWNSPLCRALAASVPHPGDMLKFRSRKYKSYWNVKTETVLDQNEITRFQKAIEYKIPIQFAIFKKYDTKYQIWYNIQKMIENTKNDRKYEKW